MPVGVVERFETVEIQQEQGTAGLRHLSPSQFAFDAIVESPTVCQLGQTVQPGVSFDDCLTEHARDGVCQVLDSPTNDERS